MTHHDGLKLKYWCEAVRHAIDLHICTATPDLRGKTTMEALFGRVPNNFTFQVFYDSEFVHEHEEDRHDKLEGRT